MNLEHRKSALSTTSFVIFEDMMDCNILIGDSTAANTISVTWDTFNQADRKYSHTFRNEQLLIDAMRNMLRKTNFNDLNEALDDEEITEEEYNNQLENFTDKYAIPLKKMQNPSDIVNIMQLSLKISNNLRELTLSEVSEIFSVKENDLLASSLQSQLPTLV
jgi:hypothetical protein